MRRPLPGARSLRAFLPRPALLGILVLALGAFSSLSWLMYQQFRGLLIGQGVQLAEQFAQTGLSVFVVRDLSGITQTAAVFRQFPGVRYLAVLDRRGSVRFETGARSAPNGVSAIAPPEARLVDELMGAWRFSAPIVTPGGIAASPFTEHAGAQAERIGQVLVEMDTARLRSLKYLLLALNVAVWVVLSTVVLRWSWKVSEVDREKSAFMATITHEMRTPLHGVIGNTQLALEALEVYEEPPDPATLHAALASAQQLAELIDRILDAHRLQAGKMELHIKPTDLREVVEEAVQSVAPRIARNANRLIQRVHVEGLISIDRGKLLQVLQNLLGNAAKFTHAGTITLRVEQGPSMLLIAVSDTGIGIPPEDAARIFEPFRRADIRDAARYEGSGLGLAISRGFIELLGGTLMVESRVSVGSTFTARIPLPVTAARARSWTL